MGTRVPFIIGITLLIAGLIRMYIEAQTAGVLLIPTCLGGDMAVSLDLPIWQRLHCWGCYAAASGASVLAFTGFKYYRRATPLKSGL